MTVRVSHPIRWAWLVGIVIVLSRLPLLGLGYGSQPDAWRVAVAARTIALTGDYTASRLPGYPLQELVSALLWSGGPWALNGLTALCSGVAVGCFLLALHQLGSRNALLGSLAFGCTPVVYVTSTMALETMWAMAGVMGGLVLAIRRRPVSAGLCVGLAIGCRITSGLMLIPLSLWLIQGQAWRTAVGPLGRFWVTAGVVGAAAFAPVVSTYGWQFFTFYAPLGYPRWPLILTRATVEVWGSLGLVALLLGARACMRHVRKRWSITDPTVAAALLGILLYGLAYLRLPHQPRYLVPIIPFVILLVDQMVSRQRFVVMCLLFMLAPFVSLGRSGVQPGPLFEEVAARTAQLTFTQRVLAHAQDLPPQSVVVAAWWLPYLEASLPAPAGVTYMYALDASEVQHRRSQGFHLFYVPGIRAYHTRARGVDLAAWGATPLWPEEPPSPVESHPTTPPGDRARWGILVHQDTRSSSGAHE